MLQALIALCLALVLLLLRTAVVGALQGSRWCTLAGVGLLLSSLAVASIGGLVACAEMLAVASRHDSPGGHSTTPQKMAAKEPDLWWDKGIHAARNPEGGRLVNALIGRTAASVPPTLARVSAVLSEFAGPHRKTLVRHLATSAKWCLTEEKFLTEDKARVYAYRRFVSHGTWRCMLGGYYLASDIDQRHFLESGHCRIVIGLDGPAMDAPWAKSNTATYMGERSQPGRLRITEDADGNRLSYLVIRSRGPALEVCEQSPRTSRSFTWEAVSAVADELSAVARSSTVRSHGFDPDLVPPESIRHGSPEIRVVENHQGAGYVVYAYTNPGAPGRAFVRVIDATREAHICAWWTRRDSLERIGWSDDPSELFFYNNRLIVRQGDSDEYFAARFELWFRPDSGQPERKLVEDTFRIHGWEP